MNNSANTLETLAKNALPTVLILASGRGERFLASGGTTHKLAASLGVGVYKKTVLQHTIENVKASGLPYHVEDVGHPGMGDCIAAAVRQTQHANGWLVLPADLPLVQPETLLRVAAALQASEVVQPIYSDGLTEQRGHPVGFGRVCLAKLLKLEGNKGAAGVLLAYNAMKLIVNDVGIITDIDTVDDLARAELLLTNRSH